jgi:hypothetical protein
MISTDIEVKQVGPDTWELLTPVEYHSLIADVVVPVGFTTDFASTPQFMWTLGMPKSGIYDPAAVVHDYLYVIAGQIGDKFYPKSTADLVFYDALKSLGVGQPKRWLMYQAVREFGKGNYSKKPMEIV